VHQPVDADGIRSQRDRGFGEFDAVLAVVNLLDLEQNLKLLLHRRLVSRLSERLSLSM
jgi:hypothetical protein